MLSVSDAFWLLDLAFDIVKNADVICVCIKTLDEFKHHNYESEHVKLNIEVKLNKLKVQSKVKYFRDTFIDSGVILRDKLSNLTNVSETA